MDGEMMPFSSIDKFYPLVVNVLKISAVGMGHSKIEREKVHSM